MIGTRRVDLGGRRFIMDIRWIKVLGRPRSAQGKFKSKYREQIEELGRREFPKPWEGDLTVVILFVFEDRPENNPDLDNATKTILDALKGIAFHDDKQARTMSMDQFYCGQRVATSAPMLPPGNALHKAAEINREECVFVGVASPRF